MSILIYFPLSFILMIVLGVISFKIASTIFSANWAGFFSGLFTTIISFLLLQYLYEHVYPKNGMALSKKIVILFPLLLNGLRILQVANIQDKTSAKKYGKLSIEMKANRPLGLGYVTGFLASLFI